jgi:hypothetical protein
MSILLKFVKIVNIIYPVIVGIVNIVRDGKDMPKAKEIK